MDSTPTPRRFDVIFDAEGRNTGKFRNNVTVHLRGSHAQSFELPTDEGGGHGGDGTAPYPLAYFASGLTACIMTQLRAFARRLEINVTDISVNTRCHWERWQTGNQPYESAPVAFTMDIELGGGASEADQRRVVEAAQKGCFVEVSIKPGVLKHRLKIGDRWIDV